MWGAKRLSVLALVVCLLLTIVPPAAFAGDRDVDVSDLKGISPKRHRWLFATLGGAALGMGVGSLVGGTDEMFKFGLVGGGGFSSWYLNTNRRAGGDGRDWAFIISNTALGTGLGWAICDCNDGMVSGALIGGGGTAAWRSFVKNRVTTAQNDRRRP